MKATTLAVLLAAFSLPLGAAAAPADNAELQKIRDADQADRQGDIDWSKVAPRDEARLERVRAIIREGNLRTATDYGNAALVFQHGNTVEDIRTAHALATLAMNMDPDNKKRRWLVAASWDRLLEYQHQPQWYGTQFMSNEQGWYVYPVQKDAVSDQQRQEMNVPTLAETYQKVSEIASSSRSKVNPTPPTLAEIRETQERFRAMQKARNAEKDTTSGKK